MPESRPLPRDTVEGLRAENAAVRATRSSADGAVTVTVNVHGEIDHVDFTDTPDLHSLEDLGRALLGATRKARAGAAHEAAANVAARLGPDAAATQALRARMPEDDDDLEEFVTPRPKVGAARASQVTPAARPLVRWDDDVEDDAGFSRS